MDNHHILHKKYFKTKGKYPSWINSPINMVPIDHYTHVNEIHSVSGNKKGERARLKTYRFVVKRLHSYVDMNYWKLSEEEVDTVEKMYRWCLIDNLDKKKKDLELIEEYKKICEKRGAND